MSIRRELISNALQKRLEEVSRKLVLTILPAEFGEMGQFVSELRERLLNTSPVEVEQFLPTHRPLESWMTGDAGCLPSLVALSLGRQLQLHHSQPPQVHSFLQELHESRSVPEKSFALLVERYSCPLNFALPGEAGVREYALTRLMVHERAKIEKGSIAACDSDYLLLKLNLLAISVAFTTDLRFLDALNYYYELLPADWRPHGQHNWLLVSYFALYAQALAAWLSRE